MSDDKSHTGPDPMRLGAYKYTMRYGNIMVTGPGVSPGDWVHVDLADIPDLIAFLQRVWESQHV
jgi:hypothetical protein